MWKDEKLFRVINENCWCPEARIKEMDETGMPIYHMKTIKYYYGSMVVNRYRTYQKRFTVEKSLLMQRPLNVFIGFSDPK